MQAPKHECVFLKGLENCDLCVTDRRRTRLDLPKQIDARWQFNIQDKASV